MGKHRGVQKSRPTAAPVQSNPGSWKPRDIDDEEYVDYYREMMRKALFECEQAYTDAWDRRVQEPELSGFKYNVTKQDWKLYRLDRRTIIGHRRERRCA